MTRTATSFGKRKSSLPHYRSGTISETNSHAQAIATRFQQQPTKPVMAAAPAPAQSAPQLSYHRGAVNVDGLKPAVMMRFVSALIDFTILIFLSFIVGIVCGLFGATLSGDSASAQVLSSGALVFTLFILWFGYGLISECSAWQGTPGKKLTGIVVTDMSGQRIGFGRALGRAFGKILSSLIPFYIPYIMVGFTNRNQTLHDMMAGTLVFRRQDLENSTSLIFD